MKKYRILLGISLPLLVGLLIWRTVGLPSTTKVSVYTVHCRNAEESVRCTGVVEPVEQFEVYTSCACRAEQVLAEVGATVEEGDVLFTVDVDATIAAANASDTRLTASDVQRELTAPVSGVITSVGVQSGKMTDTSRPCVVIASQTKLQVKVQVRESQLRRVRVGQPVYVRGDAFSQERYTGVLTYVASSAQTTAGLGATETTVEAVALLDEEEIDASLRLGLTAKVEVVVNELTDVPIVPYECVLQEESGQEYVYVVRDGYAEKRNVRTVAELSDGFAVSEGVEEGDCLVTTPADLSRDRQPVTTEEDG